MDININIDTKGLSEPGTALVQKVSDAIGGIFSPWQIPRAAKAEAEASLIKAEGEIKVTDLYRRAMHRFVEEEARKQVNIENIIKQAIPLLEGNSRPEDIDDDWVVNFFDKCRIISNEDMQRLWSQVLAREANQPGRFSKKTVNLLENLDQNDANIFMRLCRFCWEIDSGPVPLIFNSQDDIYNQNNINFNYLSHLNTLGLIMFNDITGFQREQQQPIIPVSYFGKQVLIKTTNEIIGLGKVLLTQAGEQLSTVCGATPNDDFFTFTYNYWENKNLIVKPDDIPKTKANHKTT